MLAREIYRQIHNKAEEVKNAIHAVYVARNHKPLWNAEALIEYFSVYIELSQEADIRKDDRRHVKVLYADYCGLRDELVELLTTDWFVGPRLAATLEPPSPLHQQIKGNTLVDDEGCTPYLKL